MYTLRPLKIFKKRGILEEGVGDPVKYIYYCSLVMSVCLSICLSVRLFERVSAITNARNSKFGVNVAVVVVVEALKIQLSDFEVADGNI